MVQVQLLFGTDADTKATARQVDLHMHASQQQARLQHMGDENSAAARARQVDVLLKNRQ